MVKIIVNGVGGRMGREVILAALEDADFEVVGAFEAARSPLIGKSLQDIFGETVPDVEVTLQQGDSLSKADVVIDFSVPAASVSLLPMVYDVDISLVIGTTGFEPEDLAAIRKLSESHSVLFSPNLSEGVNALFTIVPDFLSLLGRDWDVEIVEYHHRNKLDSPSGTALRFGEIISESRGRSLEAIARFGRKSRIGPREDDEICFHSIRGGEVPGEHQLIFSRGEEEIIVAHRVHSRKVFARGALFAAKILAGRGPGLYTMKCLIGDQRAKTEKE
jgi:4-hydroxy-tetrahydrodipicolinate reductase